MLRTFLRRLFVGTPKMIAVGIPCPAFRTLDTEGKIVTQADLLCKRAVLWFFPKAATPG